MNLNSTLTVKGCLLNSCDEFCVRFLFYRLLQ